MYLKEVVNEDVQEIFTLAQKTTAVHQKNAIVLKEFYENVSLLNVNLML